MMKRVYRVLIAIVAFVIVVATLGCGTAQNGSLGDGTQPSSTPASAAASGQTTQTPATATSEPTTEPPTTVSTEPTTQAPATTEGVTEANWTLEVSDTQITKVNGYDLTVTLSIMAIKLGGTDALGPYKGIVTLSYEYDMQQGNVSGNAKGSGQEVDATIKVVTYDDDAYNADSDQALGSLGAFDAMALGTLALKGSGEANEQAGGATWGTGGDGTVSVPYKLTVDGGQVQIVLPSIAPGAVFKGMIVGTPI